MTDLLICDERVGVREWLNRVMAARPFGSVETVASYEELVSRYARRRADVVLIGTQRALAVGIDWVRALRGLYPDAVVIVLGAGDDVETIEMSIASGAQGFVRWGAGLETVLTLLTETTTRLPSPGAGPAVDRDHLQLSRRELEVLWGMSQGLSNAAIGRRLSLSEETIKSHAKVLFRRLRARDRAHAVAIGYRLGLVH